MTERNLRIVGGDAGRDAETATVAGGKRERSTRRPVRAANVPATAPAPSPAEPSSAEGAGQSEPPRIPGDARGRGIAALGAVKSHAKKTAAYDAIAALAKEDAVINYASVARRAGVTRQFLYSHDDLRRAIAPRRAATARNGSAGSSPDARGTQATLVARLRNAETLARTYKDQVDQMTAEVKAARRRVAELERDLQAARSRR